MIKNLKIKKHTPNNCALSEIEENEFQQLVAEIAVLGFANSAQVSQYIVNNKLGNKYQNISGILEMKKSGEIWDFKGGFPPKIYARLCQKLKLMNNNSTARPRKFTYFKDI
ncbi:hypothetical protein AB7459_01160 [Providencia rettgeri]